MENVETIRRKRVAPYVPASALSQFYGHVRYVQTQEKVIVTLYKITEYLNHMLLL